ncbi:GNAT family N-acetyltransferase [Cumulibacter manganitolerans]|uniref:GNAT family N-acetyltransferase n=1 Tax=Cumulibacter manganitolerans TaxID=1884992 RepID=UPI0012964404|nr:GNAT family N-acetyltransferase [Cumulibacter manganitolerans]
MATTLRAEPALQPDAHATAPDAASARSYSLQIVPPGPEAELALRLRYRVFAEEMGARLAAQAGRDVDEWDAHCEHLMVRDDHTGDVVGTYRIFPPRAAARLGRSYSSTEFDLDGLRGIGDSLVEVGRSCVDPAHRNGAVVSLLWSGLARYMLLSGHRYLGGCASIYLDAGKGNAAAIVREALATHAGPEHLAVTPHTPWHYDKYPEPVRVSVPPLLRAYLRLGAKVLGEPSYDPGFHTADLYILLDMQSVDPRVTKRFTGR